jgi:uncharacterized cupredoxin-like copper-binding protein
MRRNKFPLLHRFATLFALSLALTAAPAHAHGPHRHPATAPVMEQRPWGIAGDPARVQREVVIRMTDDMRFSPDRVRVRLNETVRFVIRNDGAMLHEMVIGTRAVLDEHAALMLKFPDMEHDEPYMAHVEPGQSGEIVWHFNRIGEFDFACLIPGHYQAGMVGRIVVDR